MSENLPEALAKELARSGELLAMYKAIPQGEFGAAMIQQDIDRAVTAQASGDVVEMIRALGDLRGRKW